MYDIEIIGEIIPFQDRNYTKDGGFCNITSVRDQLKKAGGSDIRVIIDSIGGDVDTGFSIYTELRRYAKENHAKITTLAQGNCSSIATVFFLAGDERLVTEHTRPFVHDAWTYSIGNSKEFIRSASDLEKCSQMIAKHYVAHTDLTYEEARSLMSEETYISPEEALQLRFATQIEKVLRPVALLKALNKSNINKNEMSTRNKRKTKNLASRVKSFFRPVNKIIYTGDDREVDFTELETDDTIAVGDTATIEGQPAEGSIVMSSGETYVFEDGVLIEIISVDSALGEDTQEVEEIKEEVETIQEVIAELESRLEEVEEATIENAKAKKDLLKTLARVKSSHNKIINRMTNLSKIESRGVDDKKERNKGSMSRFDRANAGRNK